MKRKLVAYKLKIGGGKTTRPTGSHTKQLLKVDKENCITNVQFDKISTVFDFGIPFMVVIPEGKEEVARQELLEQNNCIWYTDESKKDNGSDVGLFEMRTGKRINVNLMTHATAYQAEVIAISTRSLMIQNRCKGF